MAFTKKEDYPSVRKPGVYLEESDERLGLNTSDLEKFSLGNWNSIVRDDKAYFSLGRDNNIVDIINRNSQYQGRPVGIEFISDSDPQSLSSSGTLPFYFVQLAVVTGMPDYVPIYPSPDAGDSPQPQIVRVIPEYYDDVSPQAFVSHNQTNLSGFVKGFYTRGQFFDEVEFLYSVFSSEATTAQNSIINPIKAYYNLTLKPNVLSLLNDVSENFVDFVNSNSKAYITENSDVDYKPGDSILEYPFLNAKLDEVFVEGLQNSITDNSIFFNPGYFGLQVSEDGPGFPEDVGGPLPTAISIIKNNLNPGEKLVYVIQPFLDFPTKLSDGTVFVPPDNFDEKANFIRLRDFSKGIGTTGDGVSTRMKILNKDEDNNTTFFINTVTFESTSTVSTPSIGGIPSVNLSSLGVPGTELLESTNVSQNVLANIETLKRWGHPNYSRSIPVLQFEDVDYEIPEFEVSCTVRGFSQDRGSGGVTRTELLYYNPNDEPGNFLDTSYPVTVELTIKPFFADGRTTFTNTPANLLNDDVFNIFYGSPPEGFTLRDYYQGNKFVFDSYFFYEVIQWGDEKRLLSDEDIQNSFYFKPYEQEGDFDYENFFAKKLSQKESDAIAMGIGYDDGSSFSYFPSRHTYNTPGVKEIKIIVYRYMKELPIVTQTILVTKNVIVNDGTLLSQDFEIFGGTDFNFLPIKENQATIGGLSDDSEYNKSITKILKDDNFIDEDYLTKRSAEQYNKDYDSGLLGQGPGNLDIGQTRVFTKPFDIYDFITNNRQAIADNDFVINSLPINSSATNIFINSNDCVVDLNPENNEFLTIQNQAGLSEQGVLVGDFALTVQNGLVKRQATMQIALRDKAKDKQAF